MSKRMFGMLVAVCFAVATPYANAGTQCGCGQVASPCGDCYGASVVSPYAGGMGGMMATDGSAQSGMMVDGGACCGQSVRYETRTIYENQMTTQMRTVTRTRMRTETRTREYTENVSVPTTQTQSYTVMVPETRSRTESLHGECALHGNRNAKLYGPSPCATNTGRVVPGLRSLHRASDSRLCRDGSLHREHHARVHGSGSLHRDDHTDLSS